jgi:alpha-methylacyl-CoA racemase
VGPLQGVKVVEIASIGPGPWCAMMLSDMGAEVLRVDRPDHVRDHQDGQVPVDFVNRRGRRSVGVDLKHPAGAEVVLRLAEQADALIEGNRTGVAERLGIGAQECLARNPRLVYGRMTGWGQGVPLAQTPGHDLNCLALTGLLHAIGPADGRLVPPLNLVGDYGTYQTSDGKWGAVGTNEPKFYRVLVEALGLSLDELPPQMDQSS